MIDADVGGEGHLGRTSLLLLCRSSLEVVDLILARHALRLHYRHRVVLAEDKVGPTPLRLHHPARFALARTRRVEQCARGACPIGHAHFRRQELLLRRLFVCGGRHVDGQQAPRLERDGGGEARKLRQPALNVERVRVVLLRPQEHFGGPDGLVECRRRARCGGGDAVGPVAPVGRRLIVDEDALKVLAAESPVKREVAHQEPARALAPAVRRVSSSC
mmetsp:Transcript_21058/g.44433  ORF Transcript_21058/g.44433 Transcript_21058/m.44433 type:complete len:218 (-) Transcript_21058:1223-1876(-)